MERRVVITGLGLVCPVGNSVKEGWDNALNGRSGIRRIEKFDTTGLQVQIAGEVRGFDATAAMGDAKEARRASPFIHYAMGAAREAMADAGLAPGDVDPPRLATCIGVGMGSLPDIEENAYIARDRGPGRVSPFFVPQSIPNMAAGYVSLAFQARGPNLCTTTACASGTHAIGEAFEWIRYGRADAAICGGAEAAITRLSVAGFANMRALSREFVDEPHRASRPFDRDRAGFIIAEGAGVLVLEELEHARKRGARIYAEVVGFGLNGDAYHITSPAPDGSGSEACMAVAVKQAGRPLTDYDHINAHGTSTRFNDEFETMGIKRLFGEYAYKLSVCSTKSVTGHLLGGAGGVEGVFSALSVFHQVVPPTINLENPDPLCDLDYTAGTARERTIRAALSNSFGFGGTNACIALAKF